MHITFIGSGNLATHFAVALKNAGHQIIQVYSPNFQNAAMLAYHVKADAIDDLNKIDIRADLFIIAVKDDAIKTIAEKMAPYQKILVHTSGATDLQTILKYNSRAGVIYPLQTFSKTREVNFNAVPLCIEGSNNLVTQQLLELGQTISKNVYQVDSGQRKVLHLAAVFACNFPNNLYAIAQSLLVQHQLNFDMLRPLILETAQKVQDNFPVDVQTGPAIRHDQNTMDAHLQMLTHYPQLQQLYDALSQSIIKMGLPPKADN